MAQNIDLNKLVPATLKNETLTSLVSNLFNRFVSQENTLQVSGRVGTPIEGDSQIKQSNLERQENALVPGLFFSSGKEKFVFTFEDFINKMEVLNIDIPNLRTWMAEQSFNYSPPIDYDKLINYANYFWTGKVVSPEGGPIWNPENDQEYYVIQRPRVDDQIKMPVRLATTRNVNLWINDRPAEVFTVTFTSQTTFTLVSDIDGDAYADVTTIPSTAGAQTKITVKTVDSLTTAPAISAPGTPDYSICEFYIVNGNTPFSIGDEIEISVTHFTGETLISVNSASLIGKGTVNGVATISPFMYLDGVQIEAGDRVLVVNQTDPSENGIYTVVQGKPWIRTADATYDSNFPVGMKVYVTEGATLIGKTYVLQTKTQLPSPPADGSINANLIFALDVSNPPIPVNEWQLYNYWVHRDDLAQFSELGVSINNTIQANRPIIEYSNELAMNSAVDGAGNPTMPDATDAIDITQVKTRFNQIPQFDLYRYDGTHSGMTSGIWYFVEDPNYVTDNVLQRRVKTTINDDYVFGCAATDDDGRLLYYKIDGSLTSIWSPGVSVSTASSPIFVGDDDSEGTLQFNNISTVADNQQWTITFITATTAEVAGARSGLVGVATVGTAFTCDDFNITLIAGAQPHSVGDTFTFSIYAPSSPRYVKKDADGNIINYPGGYAADAALPTPVGTWLTPRRMFQNLYRETREEISFGNFLNHARSVIRWQDGFVGASFGNNNVRALTFDPGLGGSIKEFSSNFPLLASMLIESDMSPITIVTFAEQQYNVALSSIDQFLISEIAGYLANGGMIETSIIDPAAADIIALEEYFEELRGQNVNLTQAFGDSTATVANWPATLPMIGLVSKVVPGVTLDPELNMYVITHHDGHISPLATVDLQFNNNLARTPTLRSDSTTSAGIFSETTPVTPRPYARQLWFKPSTGALSVFDVRFDADTAPSGAANGDVWYQRSTNSLFTWDSGLSSWVPSGASVASRWIAFVPENIRNSLVLAVEKKLYDSVHPAQQINFDIVARVNAAANDSYSEIELAAFASKYGYDTYGPDYDASNPFTWNYSQGTFLVSIPGGANIARWYSLYEAYFGSVAGALATDRPDLYPWKLGTTGFPASLTKPSGWDAAYKNTVVATTNAVSVRLVAVSPVTPPLTGLISIDGVALAVGDRVLLMNQAGPQFNGLYTVSAGAWARTADTLTTGLTINVEEGQVQTGTTWVLTTASITVNTTPLSFQQSRVWSSQMWTDISTAHSGIRLCVNTATDALLPPYVSSSSFFAGNALTHTIPTGSNLGYSFGDRGPIELVWSKSLEYVYGLARTAFRLFPLEFLDKSWGETYIKTGNNLRTERNLMSSLPAQKFLMHGERLRIVNSYGPAEAQRRIHGAPTGSITSAADFGGKVTFKVVHTASTGDVGTDITSINLSNPLTSAGDMGPSATVLEVWVDTTFVGYVLEGVKFSFSTLGVTYTNIMIDDRGIPFDIGDALSMQFTPDTITTSIPTTGTDFVYGVLGCEGCVADAAVDPSQVITVVEHQPTYSFVPGQAKVLKGLGQWFTNLMRFSNIDTDVSISSLAYRGWAINLVHRLGALIRPDSLKITSASGLVPDTGYNVMLKRSMNTQNLWISALRIQLVQMGTRQLNEHGLFMPRNDAADWVFRVEAYNVNHPIIDYNVLNTSGAFTDFYALNKKHTDVSWKRFSEVTGTASTTMPLQITGLQNVLNFVYGYVSQLEELGFMTNATDSPITDSLTGRNIDWQLEVEKFVDKVYDGIEAGNGIILNPFMDKLCVQTSVGLLGRFTDSKFLDAYSSQACYDVISSVIPMQKLGVVRTDPQTIINTTTPIFSAHLFIDEFEHAVLMNDHFSSDSSSPVIFDQFLGSYLNSAFLSFVRQQLIDSKPTLDGFFLHGDDVLRNMSSTIDALGRSYDSGQTFNESKMADHALSLIGFKSKDYFNTIGISEQTQLDFWRGMINAKGTNLTIAAFTNYKSFLNSSVDEFWAYKLATFGDARERSFPEVKIGPNDCSRQFTNIQFYSSNDVSYSALPLFMQVEAYDDTRWFSIDDLGTTLRFDSQEISEEVVATAAGYVQLQNIYHTGDSFGPSVSPTGAAMVTANILKVTAPGTYTVSGYTWINKTKLSPVKLFDYSTNSLVMQIGLWHPAIGVHSHGALELVNMSSAVDPAHYNYTTQTTDNPSYMVLKPWDAREVGRVWWDTSKLAYIPYYDAMVFPNRETRHSRWGSLAEHASIDLYQWTESNFHPSEYDAQAALQEGDSTIDQSIRLSGKVGFTNYYQADRSVTIQPIAWSQTSSSNGLAHPAFGPATFVKLFVGNDRVIADTGRLADINVVSGFNLGSWNTATNKPNGEVVIGTNIEYTLGTSVLATASLQNIPVTNFTVSLSRIEDSTIFGTRIGQIIVLNNSNSTNLISYIRMSDLTGFYQDVEVANWVSPIADGLLVIPFDQFGLQIEIERQSAGTITAATVIAAIVAALPDVFVREAVDTSTIIEIPDVVLANDGSEDFGWKVWQVPTQVQLNSDLPAPRNKWLPYIGASEAKTVTADVVADMKNSSNTWTLPNGIAVTRYNSTWSSWNQLTNVSQTLISDGVTAAEFTLDGETSIDTNRLSIYANGIQLPPATILISDNVAQVVNTLPEGTRVYMLYRAYQPTATELAFEPLIEDDFQVQTWYKVDYQYTLQTVRNSSGNITGTKYYFWVKDKTVPGVGKSMSLRQAAELLQYGNSTYMIFSQLVDDDLADSGTAYDSCAISGLGTTVTKTNSYKLRFLRDFTLRDDPEELKLKNVHTEWTLIRQHMSSKIPTQLWKILTNAICAQDAAGNALPSQTRINYDVKYGTNTRYGFERDQIFVESQLALDSLINTVLNTSLTIELGTISLIDYITALNITSSTTAEELETNWFATPAQSRATMNLIYSSSRASQINEIFFNVLNDALSSNYEFTDLFKTSMITVNSTTVVTEQTSSEQSSEFY